MKDKKLFKKWWFWAIVLVIIGGISSLGKPSDNTGQDKPAVVDNSGNKESSLPKLNADDYKGKEGLLVYKDLKNKGYVVQAEFEKQALTEANGKASDVFEPLDPNKEEDRQSVDAYVVGELSQDGDSVNLTIALSPKS